MTTQPLTTVIATNIRRLRRERSWTQADLILELRKRHVEWSRSTAADVESPGRRAIPVGELVVLAMVFGEPVDALLRPHDEEASGVEVVDGLVLEADEISTVIATGQEALGDPKAQRLIELEAEVSRRGAQVRSMEAAFEALKQKHREAESLAEENLDDARQRLSEIWLELLDETQKDAPGGSGASPQREDQ